MGARERWSRDDGFNLVELVVIIVILGILAAIAVGVFFSQREKAQRTAAKSAIRNAVTYAEILRDGSSGYSGSPADYETEAPSGFEFTTGSSERPSEISIATFDDGHLLVLAAEAVDTCLYVRLDLDRAEEVRGHHEEPGCAASGLQDADASGWP